MELSELLAQNKPFLIGVLPEQINAERKAVFIMMDGDSADDANSVYLSEFPTSSRKNSVSPTQEQYENLVRLAIEKIKSTSLKKVVTSRIKSVNIQFEKTELFNKLISVYPFAFVYALRLNNGEMWMGATPEVLLQKRKNKFQTVSLAGTQRLIPNQKLEEYTWGEKEIVEQQLVTDFIASELKNSGCRNIKISEPFTSAAGLIVHRKSIIDFESDLPLEQLVKILHPTPAVCGQPRNEALEFIDQHEPHNRSYYSGVIGFIHPNGDADLFVNLRCMRITDNRVDVFAGGGITADSDPEKEWFETELKSKTLLGIIEASN